MVNNQWFISLIIQDEHFLACLRLTMTDFWDIFWIFLAKGSKTKLSTWGTLHRGEDTSRQYTHSVRYLTKMLSAVRKQNISKLLKFEWPHLPLGVVWSHWSCITLELLNLDTSLCHFRYRSMPISIKGHWKMYPTMQG